MADLGSCACGNPATHRWMNYRSCDEHAPPAVPAPDPARTMEGIRRAWFADQGLEYVPPATPAAETMIDHQRRASGKKRSSDAAYRESQRRTRG